MSFSFGLDVTTGATAGAFVTVSSLISIALFSICTVRSGAHAVRR